MRILKKYQIFESPVVITDEDRARLTPALTGWPTLQRRVLGRKTSQPDLERLIILELVGRCRPEIINRLVMRLGKVHQQRIREQIAELVMPNF